MSLNKAVKLDGGTIFRWGRYHCQFPEQLTYFVVVGTSHPKLVAHSVELIFQIPHISDKFFPELEPRKVFNLVFVIYTLRLFGF